MPLRLLLALRYPHLPPKSFLVAALVRVGLTSQRRVVVQMALPETLLPQHPQLMVVLVGQAVLVVVETGLMAVVVLLAVRLQRQD